MIIEEQFNVDFQVHNEPNHDDLRPLIYVNLLRPYYILTCRS